MVQNNPQCQISVIRAIARARSRKVSYSGVYLFLAQFLKIGLGLVLSWVWGSVREGIILGAKRGPPHCNQWGVCGVAASSQITLEFLVMCYYGLL